MITHTRYKTDRDARSPTIPPRRLATLVINRKTADALGVTIPPQLYIFADELIE
jgi:hypothetical protein